jgi:hypothetical protein
MITWYKGMKRNALTSISFVPSIPNFTGLFGIRCSNH